MTNIPVFIIGNATVQENSIVCNVSKKEKCYQLDDTYRIDVHDKIRSPAWMCN